MRLALVEIPWHQPSDATTQLLHNNPETACTVLFSGLMTSYSGRYSYLAWEEKESLIHHDLGALDRIASSSSPLPQWFGTISYEAGSALHNVPATAPSIIRAPLIAFTCYTHVMRYDHHLQQCHYYGDNPQAAHALSKDSAFSDATFPCALSLSPHLSAEHYLSVVRDTLEHIRAGDFYQANITCKYSGELSASLTARSAWQGFMRLHQLSPAPYSAFIAKENRYIISSSPELFIQINEIGQLTTRPIKGTLGIEYSSELLYNSNKDKAENLMIVDLMRNDLSACAIIGSVHVPHLWEVDSFRAYHHLSSTITAQLAENFCLSNVLKATFPAGSMTGAPKRAAMHWIAKCEEIDRGIYSGALGWINGNSCELSVVIRTLVAEKAHYEFQVGGGIIVDSNPQQEYLETLTKARGVLSLLNYAYPPK
jgi:para-aminobenzoate synthetase component I